VSTQRRAWRALTERLKESLPAETAGAFIGGSHTQEFADNLLPGLSEREVALARDQLAEGDGGELSPTRTGKRSAHAPYSSAALAVNAFARWMSAPIDLQVAGLSGFDRVRLEEKLRISHGGGVANLDCGLRGPDLNVRVESKLTEMLQPHEPVDWRKPYRSEAMRELLDGSWRDVFDRSLALRWTPRHLGLEQLLKHALAINSHLDGRAEHLVYLYWEPSNGDDFAEVVQHRAELAQLLEALGPGPQPRFNALTYAELFDEWTSLPRPAWVGEHVDQLRRRYQLSI
jgi:hypothetical protein